MEKPGVQNAKILVTGGAGFIGSNLVGDLLLHGNKVVCLDNFLTGKKKNIEAFMEHPHFTLIEGDIRDQNTCNLAVKGVDYVLHQAALGSVPRSINDPQTTNDININGFLNILVASRDAKVKRFVYAASSSTYGDHPDLPKLEDRIGKPLSPYAITKYVNELYANVFSGLYGIETIGLRYFNVFGPHQDPDGPYAAVIPKFIKSLMDHQSPVINGDGMHSRDFTYVANVVQANNLAMLINDKNAVNTVYNVAYGDATTLNQLFEILTSLLGAFDSEIKDIKPVYGPARMGDVKHSLASVDKARQLLEYRPAFDVLSGLKEAIGWYWENLK